MSAAKTTKRGSADVDEVLSSPFLSEATRARLRAAKEQEAAQTAQPAPARSQARRRRPRAVRSDAPAPAAGPSRRQRVGAAIDRHYTAAGTSPGAGSLAAPLGPAGDAIDAALSGPSTGHMVLAFFGWSMLLVILLDLLQPDGVAAIKSVSQTAAAAVEALASPTHPLIYTSQTQPAVDGPPAP